MNLNTYEAANPAAILSTVTHGMEATARSLGNFTFRSAMSQMVGGKSGAGDGAPDTYGHIERG